MQQTRTRARTGAEILKELVAHVFCYHRVGFDRRWMTFNADGKVGHGARTRETCWNLLMTNGVPTLEISSDEGLTCRLKRQTDGSWTGKWRVFEKMPVWLYPAAKLKDTVSESFSHPLSAQLVPRSLFIVSLPRSLSSLVYHKVRHAMGLDQPSWTTDGEILNMDRNVLMSGNLQNNSSKYLHRMCDSGAFSAVLEFLDPLVFPFGHAYKDVVQPFVVADWLKNHPMPVLRVKRSIADVAYSMLSRDWQYPGRIVPKENDRVLALIQGLMCAERTLETIKAEVVNFDEIIKSEEPLNTALRKLSPGRLFDELRFIDRNFMEARDKMLERRKTVEYVRLLKYVDRVNKDATQHCI